MILSELTEALLIFRKYNMEKYDMKAEHDVIYGPPANREMTEEDLFDLSVLGWWISDRHGCWCAFV